MVTATFLISAFSLMLVGIFGILTRKNIIRILLAVNILETGVNLLLVALGYFPNGSAPIITSAISAASLPFVDPLPQALVLTSIVIGLGTTALALAITLRYYAKRHTLEFAADEEDLPTAPASPTSPAATATVGTATNGGNDSGGAPKRPSDEPLPVGAHKERSR